MKILARTSPLSTSLLTPLRLYEKATGPTTSGRSQAALFLQRVKAVACSVAARAESEPPKSTRPALKFLTPAPEPVALYSILALFLQASLYEAMICWMALVWAVEPSPVMEPEGQAREGPDAEVDTDPPVVAAVVLEQAARERALRAATAAIFETRVILSSSFGQRSATAKSACFEAMVTRCPIR